MPCLSLMMWQRCRQENKRWEETTQKQKLWKHCDLISDLGLNLNIWNVDVKTNAIIFTNNIKQDFLSRENHLLKSIKTRLFLYLLNFILHLIEARSSHFARFSSAICSLFHKIPTAAFQLFKPKNTLFEYYFTPQPHHLHTIREQIQPY